MKILSSHQLTVQYDQTVALKDVSFELNEGEYLCIVGENGSGKSTLVKTLLGLIKPKSGQIRFNSKISREEIGYLPQTTLIQRDFPASVYEVVLSGCLNKRKWQPFYSKSDKERVLKNMKRLAIENLKGKSFRELSGGQQQRVLIARALCASEKVLLLDEPVTGLDPGTTAELYELIHQLNQELGLTVIMITHDITSGLNHATKVLHLQKEVLFYGSVKEYQQKEFAKCHRGGLHHA